MNHNAVTTLSRHLVNKMITRKDVTPRIVNLMQCHSTRCSKQQHSNHDNSRKFPFRAVLSAGVVIAVGTGVYQMYRNNENEVQVIETSKHRQTPLHRLLRLNSVCAIGDAKVAPGELKEGLPTYTHEEVSKHVSKESGIWVTYKNGVYDITDYVKVHPGGKMILMAAGKSMEPFWDKFTIHYNDTVYEMLEYFRIGNIREVAEAKKSPDSGAQSWMMPEDKDLDIEILAPIIISMERLRKDFQKKAVVTAVKCSSGNSEKREMKWSGVALSDLMRAQGVDLDKVESKYLVFESLQKNPDNTPFVSRYPMELARSLKDEIIVAYEVNGEPIPPLQGHPYRVILKGHGGGKQVKWLRKIRLSTKEEDASMR